MSQAHPCTSETRQIKHLKNSYITSEARQSIAETRQKRQRACYKHVNAHKKYVKSYKKHVRRRDKYVKALDHVRSKPRCQADAARRKGFKSCTSKSSLLDISRLSGLRSETRPKPKHQRNRSGSGSRKTGIRRPLWPSACDSPASPIYPVGSEHLDPQIPRFSDSVRI